MKRMTLSEYLAVPENYRGVWTTERWDIPDWENLRKNHMGKRTLMVYDKGTCLLVEGLSLEIVDDSAWKKPEEIKKEIREKYQEYRTERDMNRISSNASYAGTIPWRHWRQESPWTWIPIRKWTMKSSSIAILWTTCCHSLTKAGKILS